MKKFHLVLKMLGEKFNNTSFDKPYNSDVILDIIDKIYDLQIVS